MNDRLETGSGAGTEQRAEAWHGRDAEAVVQALETRPEGLAEEEADARLARHGPNSLPPPRGRSAWRRLLDQFRNVLIYVLVVAGVVTAVLGHTVDSAVIFAVVVINALIGYLQEGKAEHALDAIRGMLSPRARVLRDGRARSVDAADLVPGDMVRLESGDRVPADLRLLQVKALRIQEAALTGESLAVDKATEPVPADAALGDRHCMAYSGTLVVSGRGTGVVVATGTATEIGHISRMLAQVTTLTTPLVAQMNRFARTLSIAIVGLAAAVFAFGILARGYSAVEMFLAAVGIAVAAIPEGLPAILTITLAIGVQRMAERNAIIRRLPAVETLGSVTVICTDKTGTLTRNEMMVQSVATAGAAYEVTGTGYCPEGKFLHQDREVDPAAQPRLLELLRAVLLCSDASIRQRDGCWLAEGDPTEAALVALAAKAGLDSAEEIRRAPRADVIPFESEHRFMATLHHPAATGDGAPVIYVKGAPERLLEMCDRQRGRDGDEPLDADSWEHRMAEIAGQGQRLLAVAAAPAQSDQRSLEFSHLEEGLVLLGVLGLADPPREEAVAAVARCRQAGIRVKMITGDHRETAQAIGSQVGLEAGGAVTGPELSRISDADLPELALATDVFARAAPEHKLRLVEALQSTGQVVAMTGDGVNDAPALKRADVGVAMGRNGTEAAREAAEMVLADDNFASIARAVEEGRTVYDNLRKAIVFILPTNGGEALVIIGAILFGRLLPITPVQILWINMITAVTLALALAFEPAESRVMHRPPRPPSEPLLTPFLMWRIGFVSLVLLTGTFGLFVWERSAGTDIETARTVAVNTLVLFEAFYLVAARRLYAPGLTRGALRGARPAAAAIALVLVFQLLMTYAPPLQALFDTRALDGAAWLRAAAVAASVLVLVELEKAWLRWRQAAAQERPRTSR